MAKLDAKFRREYKAVFARIEKAVNRKVISEAFKAWHGDELIAQVIASAKAGHGRGDTFYPAYSEAYAAKVASSGKRKPWLVGIDTAPGGSMLARERFGFTIDAQGTLWLRWTPDPAVPAQAVYGRVHQEGLPLGPGGPKKLRPFVQITARQTAGKVTRWWADTMRRIVAQVNAGQNPGVGL